MGGDAAGARPEVWAGIECTVNRVGDRHYDQLVLSGHDRHAEDMALFGWLGVQAARYPVLWERTAPHGLDSADWSWPDARLAALREQGVRPIVGLVHHGSGPLHTSLIDDAFPEKLAAYAAAVAARYPWVDDWTPVNEPCTTARFAGLYGLWYPHGRDAHLFARALVNQCRGTVLAMRAIRTVNPRARLIQTDDFGRTSSTPALAYQAEHDNGRRLLTFELLCGRVTPEHPFWRFLIDYCRLPERDLQALLDEPCPPDVIGLNYYLTSDRFLDERLHLYPPETHGGNGRHSYADVEAVRVEVGPSGHRALLDELWRRYHIPLAITEVHLGCSREEQLRWLHEAWAAVLSARAAGIDVRALTGWSMLGAFDWDKLLCPAEGRSYEAGLFDVRSQAPRPTALGHALRVLAREGRLDHPALATPGWWRRPERIIYRDGANEHEAPPPRARRPPAPRGGEGQDRERPLLIVGASGTLGRAFARVASGRGLVHRLLSRGEMDIADPASVARTLDAERPWAVINAAGYVRVDDAEQDRAGCLRENLTGPRVLAEACGARGIRLVTFSSDLVFNGQARSAYVESAAPDPLGVYGWSKAAAERAVLEALPGALVIRTAAFFGPWDPHNFVEATLRTLEAGGPVRAADDLVVSPTYVPDLASTTLDLLIDEERGLWHVANDGQVSWAELARKVARLSKLDDDLVQPCPARELGLVARRPRYSALTSERARMLRPLDHALAEHLRARARP